MSTPVTKAIQNFFDNESKDGYASGDILDRYHSGMEIQINVGKGDGRPTERKGTFEDKNGNRWWSIRVPKKSNSLEAEWNDYGLNWSIRQHAVDIGMTGWNWKNKQSIWVAFDFDSIVGHAEGVGISDDQLEEVRRRACGIPWVQVRNSTSGGGLHLYVFFENPPTTQTHTEHAALGRAVLDEMGLQAGFNFSSKVDACGQNMWIWSRRANKENEGFKVIKAAEYDMPEVPDNWRDHVDVVKGKRHKVKFRGIEDADQLSHEELIVAEHSVPLDDKHRAILDKLRESDSPTFWSSDHQLIQTHTRAFEWVMEHFREDLDLVGEFETSTSGSTEINCFAFPITDGGWKIYRFGGGSGTNIQEADTWDTTSNGWTYCFFNARPNLDTVLSITKAVECENGVFQYPDFPTIQAALKRMGTSIQIGTEFHARPFSIVRLSDRQKVAVSCDKKSGDAIPDGWAVKGRRFLKVLTIQETDVSMSLALDGSVRHMLDSNGTDLGWYARTNVGDNWTPFKTEKVRAILRTEGINEKDMLHVLGDLVKNSWLLVNVPFGPDHPQPRQWNFDAPQFAVEPKSSEETEDGKSKHPHWDMIFGHAFQSLDERLLDNEWAMANGIRTGMDYAYVWIASMFRHPFDPLPYLFFHGPEGSGKTIIAEALQLLMTRGVARIDNALRPNSTHNGELAGAVFGFIDETDISQMRPAERRSVQNKVKDWVTSKNINIRKMHTDTYMQPNCMKMMQFTNHRDNCCVSHGDTRIVAFYVPVPKVKIPKIGENGLMSKLEKEAPAFLYTILEMEIPEPVDRLRVPVINTATKEWLEDSSLNQFERWMKDKVHTAPGHMIKVTDFINAFYEWLPNDERSQWKRSKILSHLNDDTPVGRATGNVDYIANVSFDKNAEPKTTLVRCDNRLKESKKDD